MKIIFPTQPQNKMEYMIINDCMYYNGESIILFIN